MFFGYGGYWIGVIDSLSDEFKITPTYVMANCGNYLLIMLVESSYLQNLIAFAGFHCFYLFAIVMKYGYIPEEWLSCIVDITIMFMLAAWVLEKRI